MSHDLQCRVYLAEEDYKLKRGCLSEENIEGWDLARDDIHLEGTYIWGEIESVESSLIPGEKCVERVYIWGADFNIREGIPLYLGRVLTPGEKT